MYKKSGNPAAERPSLSLGFFFNKKIFSSRAIPAEKFVKKIQARNLA
jgi:hypothetical protein